MLAGEEGKEGRGRLGGGGNHSSENGSAVKEGPDCTGTAREQHAQPNQGRHKEKVLLSTSNGPLDNHTGAKLLYLTLIAKTARPPITEPHDSLTFPPSPPPTGSEHRPFPEWNS